jgi:hypothetical protein
MADKDFKVKTGLDLPAPLPVVEGGTGQTSVENTRNALMPAQTGHSGKFITTDGTGMSWAVAPQQTATDGAAGYKVYAGNTAPTGQNTGDIWIDASTGNGIQLVRWRKTIASSGSTITGLDDNNLTLSYTAGNEQVYINGTLITRGQDYTATNGTSVVLTQAAEIGDTLEIFGNPLFSVTDAYTQSQSNSLYVAKSGFDAAGKNLIINGGFDHWQRGTTFSSITSGTYSADRWWYGNSGASNYTVTRRTLSDLPNFQYSVRLQRASGNTQTASQYFANVFETVNSIPYAGKTVTLSYYAKVGANYSGGTSLNAIVSSGTTVDVGLFSGPGSNTATTSIPALTTAWQKFTSTGTIFSNATQVCIFFVWAPTGTAGADDWVEITGVQLEVGSVSTPFSRAGGNIQGELAACQRYFERIGQNSYSPYGTGLCGSTTTARVNVTCQPKRNHVSVSYGTASTFEVWNSGFAGVAVTGISSVAVNRSQVNVGITVASGLVAGNSTILIDGGTGNSYIDFSAEL